MTITNTQTSQQEHIFNVFAQFPDGLAAYELRDLLDPDTAYQNVSALLSLYVSEGVAEKRGSKINPATGHSCTVYAANGTPYYSRRLIGRDNERGKPTPRKLTDRIVTLQARIDGLEAWKAEAIKRFPELGVDPVILAARKSLAAIMRSEGMGAKAVLIERGELDDGENMRIVVSIMRTQPTA